MVDPEKLEGLEKLAELDRELKLTSAKIAVDLHSRFPTQQIGALALSQEKLFANIAPAIAATKPLETTNLPVYTGMAALQGFEDLTLPSEVFQQIPPSTIAQMGALSVDLTPITSAMVSNKALFEAVEQSTTIANAVQELNYRSVTYEPEVDEVASEVESEAPEEIEAIVSVYDRTTNPYGPFQDDVRTAQTLIASVIMAAAVDDGELSADLSEEQKKGIRMGLAMLVGLAVGIPVGVAIGIGAGIGGGLGAGAWTSSELEDYYDIKQRQQLPEDDSE